MRKIVQPLHALLMFALILTLSLSISVFKAEMVQFLDGSSHNSDITHNSKKLEVDRGSKIDMLSGGKLNCRCESLVHYMGMSAFPIYWVPLRFNNSGPVRLLIWEDNNIPLLKFVAVRNESCDQLRVCSRDLARQMELEGGWPVQTIEQYKRTSRTRFEEEIPHYEMVCRANLGTIVNNVYAFHRVGRLRRIPFNCSFEAMSILPVRP